jgi:predicted dehydrogenase
VTVHAVCDASRGRAVNAARKHGIPHILTSIDELVRSDCDAVHVLLPPALHVEAARALVEAGKSVFLEKPMGLDSGACAALCARAAVKGVAVGVNHNFLFSRGYESLRAIVKSGELGRIDHLGTSLCRSCSSGRSTPGCSPRRRTSCSRPGRTSRPSSWIC